MFWGGGEKVIEKEKGVAKDKGFANIGTIHMKEDI